MAGRRRILDRLEMVMQQIAELEQARDAVLAKEAASGEAETMIRSLARLKRIGAELATVLVWEAYVRSFSNRKVSIGTERTPGSACNRPIARRSTV